MVEVAMISLKRAQRKSSNTQKLFALSNTKDFEPYFSCIDTNLRKVQIQPQIFYPTYHENESLSITSGESYISCQSSLQRDDSNDHNYESISLKLINTDIPESFIIPMETIDAENDDILWNFLARELNEDI